MGASISGAIPDDPFHAGRAGRILLAGCTSDPHQARVGHPPEDPADYHGVPTDMTPPSMLDAPPPKPTQ